MSDKEDLIKHLEKVQQRYGDVYDTLAETTTEMLLKLQNKDGKVPAEDLAAFFMATRRLSESFEALIPEDALAVYNAVLDEIRKRIAAKHVQAPEELKSFSDDSEKLFNEAKPPAKEWLN